VGSGQLISQIISVITVPILSRIYADTAYGDTAMITSTAAVIINITTFGLSSAIMKPEKTEGAKKVFTTAFLLNVLITTVLIGICLALKQHFSLFIISGDYTTAILLMWLYIITYSTNSLMTVYMNKQGKYNKLFFNPIIGSGAQVLLAIPLGLLGFGYKGFMLTNIAANTVAITHMMWKNLPFYKGYRFSDFLAVIRTYKEYVLYQYPSNFIATSAIEYPTQYLGRCFTTQQLGGYSLCVRVMKYPIRLIAAPISTVYFRTATEYHREGKNLAAFTYKMISRILLISAVPVAAFIFVSEPVFAFVLGEEWRTAGTMAGFLCVQYVLLFCSQCTSYCRVAIGRQNTNLLCSLIRLGNAVLFGYVGYAVFHSLMETVFVISLGECLYNIYDMAVNFYVMDRKYLGRYLVIAGSFMLVLVSIVFVKILGL
jgi:O-antigen/teichoic acid export membrane protein